MEVLNKNYEDFIHHLADREYFGQKLGLERIKKLLNRLGNPHNQFPSIHIAGTNGKGSTAAMIASIFRNAGYRTGLYTSPHLVDFCERIRIGNDLIQVDEVMFWVKAIHKVEDEPLTFFELATAIAFLHFADKKVDIAVIETGLGGRLDATNILKPLVSVITTIDYDHRQHLGNTLEAIAREKAGIIKNKVPVVIGNVSDEAREVILEIANQNEAKVVLADRKIVSNGSLSLAGDHQWENAALAVATIQSLADEFPLATKNEVICKGLESLQWPGRIETIQESPRILLDGAHNVQAMKALRNYLEKNLKGRRLWLLFGAMADKEIESILAEIAPIADHLILTAPAMKRAADPQKISELIGNRDRKVKIIQGTEEALAWILGNIQNEEVLVVTGSLFLVGEARKWFMQKN